MNTATLLAAVNEGITGRTLKIRELSDGTGEHQYDIVVSQRGHNIDVVGGPMTAQVMDAWLAGYLSCLDNKFYSSKLQPANHYRSSLST